MIPDEIRKAAWSVRESSHLGEYLGSEWNETCETTFHYYRDRLDPSRIWYDTDENRLMERHLRDWVKMGRPEKRPRPDYESLPVGDD